MNKAFSKPRVAGIVAEYNPFHNGHKMMVDKLKQSGFDTVLCVMSGSFVQRAEPALLPVAQRTMAALQGGVDLVLRLPAPWAVSSAEAFSRAGVGLLWALGCVDAIAFGAETPDTDLLESVAKILISPDFKPVLQKKLKLGMSFASARAAAAEELLAGSSNILSSPNNILAVEYCKALQDKTWENCKTKMPENKPSTVALPRKGARHDGPPEQGISSASWIRAQTEQDLISIKSYVPESTYKIMCDSFEKGSYLDRARWETVFMGRLKGLGADTLSRYPGSGEGLAQRMESALKDSQDTSQLYDAVKSKRFAHSRVRRLGLNAALDFKSDLPQLPPFIHILGASDKGLELLKIAKESAVLPVSTSLAKLRQISGFAKDVVAMEDRAEDIYSFCQRVPKPGGGLFTHPVIVFNDKYKI